MPAERKESALSKSFSRMTDALDGSTKEYVWGCELTKENPEAQWEFEEEDEDCDYMEHTLFLRHVVLGRGAKEGERNILEVQTKNFAGKNVTHPFISLTLGKQEMSVLDLNFSHVIPVTFRLIEGSGPVHLTGQHAVDFPEDRDMEPELEYTEDDATATETEEESSRKSKGAKRKGMAQAGKKQKQRGKLDSSALSTGDDDEEDEEDDDEEDDDAEEDESMEDDEEMESEEEDEEEEEESPEKPKKGKAAKGKAKAVSKPVAKAAKGGAKKAGKKGKAK